MKVQYYIFLQWDKMLMPICRVNTFEGLRIQLEKLGCEMPANIEERFNECSNQYIGKSDNDEDIYVCEILDEWEYVDDL